MNEITGICPHIGQYLDASIDLEGVNISAVCCVTLHVSYLHPFVEISFRVVILVVDTVE